MHNTTHYRTLMLCVIMLMMMITTGCPGGNKQKETSPKKKTEKEGISSTNEADTDNKNNGKTPPGNGKTPPGNGKTPPGNGKTLDHYKQSVEKKFSSLIYAKDDSEKKQLILAYATILAVLDDNEKAVDEGLKATGPAMLLEGLRLVLNDIDPPYASLVKLGIIAAASKAKPIKEEKKRIRAEIRKKSKKVLDNLLEKTDDGTTYMQYREDKTRKKNPRTMVTKLLRKKLKEEPITLNSTSALVRWCIENGFSNAEDKKYFVGDLTKTLFIPITVDQGDLETMRLLVKAGLDLRRHGYLSIAKSNGHTEMVKLLKDNGAT